MTSNLVRRIFQEFIVGFLSKLAQTYALAQTYIQLTRVKLLHFVGLGSVQPYILWGQRDLLPYCSFLEALPSLKFSFGESKTF